VRVKRFFVLIVVAVGMIGFCARANAAEPAVEVAEAFHAALIAVAKRGGELGIQGRYKELEPKVQATFDLPVMTKFTVGPKWSSMPQADQAALIAAFTRMTVATYANNFAKFEGQKFEVDPKVEVRNADTLVKTQVVPKGEKPMSLTYRMRNTGGSWKVIDVIFQNVSELATRRADFSTTIASGGAAALVKKLDAISDKLMKGKS
jgi:phospholipid transport system substrate-binding protein